MTVTPQGRIAYLDGIRALAIFSVIASHWGGSYLGLFEGGYVGVDLFFVLSGYIITKIVWRKRETIRYRTFLSGRVRRLYPALIGVVAVTVTLVTLTGAFPPEQGLIGGVFALTQVNSIVEGLDLASSDPFGVTWSLSAEWLFYLVWPCALILGRHHRPRFVAMIAIIVALVLFAAAIPTGADWFYYGPVSRGAQLLVGSAVALLTVSWRPREAARWPLELAALLSIAFLAVWVFFGPSHLSPQYRLIGYPLVTTCAVVLILIGLARPGGISSWILSLPVFTAIGRASYSLYLWHVIPVMVLDKDVMPLPVPVLGAIGVAGTVILTWLSYRYLERPFLSARGSDIEGRADSLRTSSLSRPPLA